MADNSNLPDSVSEQHLNFTQDGGEPDLCQMEGLQISREPTSPRTPPPEDHDDNR